MSVLARFELGQGGQGGFRKTGKQCEGLEVRMWSGLPPLFIRSECVT